MSWVMFLAGCIATSVVYLVMYYLPALELVKKKMIEEGYKIKENSYFNGIRVTLVSIIYLITYTLLAPLVIIPVLFASKKFKKMTYKHIYTGACTNA